MKIAFTFNQQQKDIWTKLPELCEPACASAELFTKISNSLQKATGNKAAVEITDEEFNSLFYGGMPIQIGDDENTLMYPIIKDGYWLIIE